VPWNIQGNSEFDKEFANLDSDVQSELHPMMHDVITNSNLDSLDFVQRIEGTNIYFISTADGNHAVVFEDIPFFTIQFLSCF
jgi:hypothetical protein